MVGPSPSAFSRFPVKSSRYSRAPSTQPYIVSSSRAGSKPSGRRARPAVRRSSIRSPPPAANSWSRRPLTGAASPRPSTSSSRRPEAMRWLDKLIMQMRMLLHRGRAGDQLQNELQFHLEQQIAENLAAGMGREEARRAALRSFGNPTALRDQARETWSWRWLETLLREARISVRTLLRTPGFALVAVLVMALGIGANVALFTVVHSVLLKPLPFEDPGRLVALRGQDDLSKVDSGNVVAAGDFYDWQKA